MRLVVRRAEQQQKDLRQLEKVGREVHFLGDQQLQLPDAQEYPRREYYWSELWQSMLPAFYPQS